MNHRVFIVAPAMLAILFCKGTQETTTSSSTTTVASTTTGASAPPATAIPADSTTVQQTTAAPAPAASGAIVATEDTNWPGVKAEVTEFRRKGNTLTAKVRFTNTTGSGEPQVEIIYKDVYLIDTAGGKKYEVLRDEKGNYIGATRSGWTDRWYEYIKPGEPLSLWIKFPAPPAEVKAITLQIPKTPPFEDLPIQD